MCSADLPHTLRLYTEVFGFADAGGRAFWGPWLGVQALGPDAAALVWWLVGRQDFVQLEVFHHTTPAQRPLPDDWRPSDHGWVRWGLAVPDFDAALERLRGMGIATLSEPAERDGLRRVGFRDPDVGVIVEVMEDGAALAGGIRPRHYDLVPDSCTPRCRCRTSTGRARSSSTRSASPRSPPSCFTTTRRRHSGASRAPPVSASS